MSTNYSVDHYKLYQSSRFSRTATMDAATNTVSQVEEEISVKQDRLHKLLWENLNKRSPEFNTAFSEAFTDLFLATWERYQDRTTLSFDDEIGGVAIDSQVETDVEKVDSTTKDSYDLIGAGILDLTATTNCSRRLGESQMTEDEIVFKSKSISLDSGDLSSYEGNLQSITIVEFSCVNGFSDVKEV